MKPQSPEAAALLARYRQEHALPDAVRARARGALAQRIAAGAASSAPDVAWPVPSAPRSLRWVWLSATTASLIALLGLVAWQSAPPAPSAEPSAAAIAPAATQRAAREATTAPPSRQPPSPDHAEPASAPAGPAPVDRTTRPRDVGAVSSSSEHGPRSVRSPATPLASDTRRAPTPAPSTPGAPADTPALTSAPPVVNDELPDARPRALPVATDPVRSAPDQPRHDSLDVEVQLLRDAHDRLSAGQPLNALSILSEHARRFPNGQLRDMREVSRVIALCELGRVDEARARAQRFLQEQPRSHYAARLRSSCAVEPESHDGSR